MRVLDSLVVVGCGMIGGSIVRAARARGAARSIAAIDLAGVLAEARASLDGAAEPGSNEARALLAGADLVVLATPVGAIVDALGATLDAVAARGVVTDTGSVKSEIAAASRTHARARRFVPGHPMAGRERGGFEASSPELFVGARWFVCEGADADAERRVDDLARALGAEPVRIEPDAHDEAMAVVSHAPHLVASAVYLAAARADATAHAGPGFRDATRIAGGPSNVWRDVLARNAGAVARALATVEAELATAREGLERGDATAALALLDAAREARARAGGKPS